MSDVTRILAAIKEGRLSGEDLIAAVYDELHRLAAAKLARERPGQTLQPTALVHDVYLKLFGAEGAAGWESRRHFFGAAAEAMRRILINRARDRRRHRRGEQLSGPELERLEAAVEAGGEDLLALDRALERLASVDAQSAELVKLRFFAGMRHGDAARVLGMPRRSADRVWAFARAWLHGELKKSPEG